MCARGMPRILQAECAAVAEVETGSILIRSARKNNAQGRLTRNGSEEVARIELIDVVDPACPNLAAFSAALSVSIANKMLSNPASDNS